MPGLPSLRAPEMLRTIAGARHAAAGS